MSAPAAIFRFGGRLSGRCMETLRPSPYGEITPTLRLGRRPTIGARSWAGTDAEQNFAHESLAIAAGYCRLAKAEDAPLRLRQHVRPLGADLGVELLARARHDREGGAARPWLAGVDDDPGVARVVAAVGHGVEHRAPAAAQHLEPLPRFKAGAHRPHHLIHVGWVDVVVDHHDDAVGIDRKSTRLNSSHLGISYAVFC